jgi:hypothetical protein
MHWLTLARVRDEVGTNHDSVWAVGLSICHCRMPIGLDGLTAIRNRQLTIGNQETHPLSRMD